jgi:hypothetical protein
MISPRIASSRLGRRVGGCALIVTLVVGWARGDSPVDFRREVAPIFERQCLRCHRPGNKKGDVSLATMDDLIAGDHVVPGQPDESGLLGLVTAPGPDQRPEMPKQGTSLSIEQRDVLRRWISEGAAWPKGLVLQPKAGPDLSWWSLRPLADVQPPNPGGIPDAWAHNPIDRFVLAKLLEKGLQPSPPADRRALIRRVTYDLTGLPPTPEEVEAFVSDQAPEAYEAVVDRLLASPHHGEQWGRHWLDVVRFGESTGFERNVIIDNAWPFRDYVIRAFNQDETFERLVLEHLAGDVIGRGDPAVEVGTGFLVCGPYDNVGNQDAVQSALIRANTLDDVIRGTSETFLGLTIGCARCHDHKFDPILQQDYHRLYATFDGVRHGSRVVATPEARREQETRVAALKSELARVAKERTRLDEQILARGESHSREHESRWVRPPADPSGTEETFAPVEARYVRLIVVGLSDSPALRSGFGIDEFEVWTSGDGEPSRNVALAANGGQADGASRVAKDFADAYSPKLTIDGMYGARWIAGGPDLTITLARPERIDRVVFSSTRGNGDISTRLKASFGDYRIEVSLDGAAWTEVAGASDRKPQNPAWRRKRQIDLEATAEERGQHAALDTEQARINRELAAVQTLLSWWVGDFRQAVGPYPIFLGGDPQRKGDPVVPSSLSFLGPVAPGYELSADAPEDQRRLALARWIVAPENPLTPRVLANRLWHYHFGTGIVDTPSDFGAMGSRPTHPELLDWLARQVHAQGWRLKPLHRLIVTSQAYRQSATFRPEAARVDGDSRFLWRFPPRRLAAEEVRDTMLELAGQLDRRMGGPGFRLYRYLEDNVATYVPLDEHGPETYRRAVYHQNARASRVDVLTDFDCPDSAFAAPRRAATTTPLQALTLMNHRFTLDMASFLAERLKKEARADDPEGQVRSAFLLAYARPPDAEEVALAARLIRRRGLRAFCRALLNSNELITLN